MTDESGGAIWQSSPAQANPARKYPMSHENRPLPELVSFLETLEAPHILGDREYRVIAANSAYRKSLGGGRSVVGRTCYEISHHYSVPCDRACESCPLARSLASGQRERVLHLHQNTGHVFRVDNGGS